jgi:hypothetical protein
VLAKKLLRHRNGADDIEIRDGALCHRRGGSGGRHRRLPLTSIREVQIEREDGAATRPGGRWRVRIVPTSGRPMLIANELGHDQRTVAWIKSWIETKIEDRLRLELPAAPSAPAATA